MDQDFGVIELLPSSLPLPLSTSPPPSSFSQLPLHFRQAGQLKWNYWLPAWYEDVNLEPLWLLKEDEQPSAALLHPLIVHNQLQTATNFFGLLREYLYLWSWLFCSQRGPLLSWRNWSYAYFATISIPCSSKWIRWNSYELEGLWHIHEVRCWSQSSCKQCPSWPWFQAWIFATWIYLCMNATTEKHRQFWTFCIASNASGYDRSITIYSVCIASYYVVHDIDAPWSFFHLVQSSAFLMYRSL